MPDNTEYAFSVDLSDSPESDPLFPVRKDGKWGYINQLGNVVIAPKFLQAGRFIDGMARVALFPSGSAISEVTSPDPKATFFNRFNRFDKSLGSKRNIKYLFIDKSGSVVLNPNFDFVDQFYNGLARISNGDEFTGKWGFIDKEGNVVIEPNFQKAMPFSEGLAEVKINFKSGFIDKTGNVVIEPKFIESYAFSDGLALVCLGIMFDRRFGYIDRTGKMVIKPVYSEALSFSEGLAPVTPWGFYEGVWGYIDKSGNLVIKPKYDRAYPFSEGLAFVNRYPNWKIPNIFLRSMTEPSKQALINKKGEVITDFVFSRTGNFSDGLCRVSLDSRPKDFRDDAYKQGKTGYLDKSGSLKIPYQFNDAHDFYNGLAYVKIGDQWGYINKNGSFVYRPTK